MSDDEDERRFKQDLEDIEEDEDEKALRKELDQRLLKIPQEFKTPKFDPLPSVVKVLQSSKPEETMKELEEYFESMEAAMNLIVDGA